MFKVGDKVQAISNYQIGSKLIGTIVRFTDELAPDGEKLTVVVVWDNSSADEYFWNENDLMTTIEGNDILKDLCSK